MRREYISATLCLMLAAAAAAERSRYGFYRDMTGEGEGGDGNSARRVFGGAAADLEAFPAACALLDRYWASRCSCALVAARWVLTAAHCVSPRIAYVKYNARRPAEPGGDVAPVHYLYRHPEYRVVQEDRGRGPDVTELHHDVGLVRTRDDMRLTIPPHLDPLRAMTLYKPDDLKNEEVLVFGFGRTERVPLGEELFSVRLRVVPCERGSWFHCVCGGGGGVCSGDSGGPAVYRGVQVAVTSMGPMECAARANVAGTSVLTALHQYADLVNATIHETETAMRMNRISSAALNSPPRYLPRATLLPLLLLSLGFL